ncbi:major tail protein [Macrococcoides caseolyticum]|uniref:major tail protein n=1 Tax=Macrococcoides caseolyticum TaxID=69966 RepID=UPI001F3F2588|nr:major tail protein [Macrococcus caseolyticus]MCE4957255.1 hypothetical protein [Macrococcus caseolyticus]
MAETKNVKIATGVRALRFAKITEDNKDTLTIEPIITVAEDLLQKFSVQPESSMEKIPASNKTVAVLSAKNGGKVSIELASLPEELDLAIQGATKDADGLITYTSEDISPYFAVSAEITYNDGTFAMIGLGKVAFELINIEAETAEDKAKPQSHKLEGQVLDRINGVSWYKVKMSSDEAGFDKAKFDAKVFKTATI